MVSDKNYGFYLPTLYNKWYILFSVKMWYVVMFYTLLLKTVVN